MIRIFTLLFVGLFFLSYSLFSQVKQEYLYNTGLPYGTLDIRTKVSASQYYYLQEGVTFSFRESTGVKTNTYADMTDWDSSPYKQGNLRKKEGSADAFVMNYRLLQPANHLSTYAKGYPMIVLFHGAIERANCYYGNCYHSNSKYNPNVNDPPAPTSSDHPLLNNDNQLIFGGREHLNARDAAGSKLPDDPSLPQSAFPGFVLVPQMMNGWDSLNVQDVVRLVQLHCEKYNIDQDRIYIEGLSIGGYGVYEALKRASWLFAAAMPMSAVSEAANIFKHNQQKKVAHIPLWVFQGGFDKNPSPAFTEDVLRKFKSAGALPKYTFYAKAGHRVWERSFYEPTFFEWLLQQSKHKLHVLFDNRVIDQSKNSIPKLVLAEGFLAYQWEKDGVILSSAKSNELAVTEPGVYRARFSRKSSNPTASQWNEWSPPVTITIANNGEQPGEEPPGEEEPGGEQPGEEQPGGEQPGEEEPGEEEPGEEEPGGEEPGEQPGGEGPEEPGGETPGGEQPGENPGEEEPGENPGGEEPGGEQPGNENPGEEPGEEEPGGEQPGGEEPGGEEPGEQPGGQNPSGETPGEDPNYNPGEETPVPGDTTEIVDVIPDIPRITITLYPNPTSGQGIAINFSRALREAVRIVIYNVHGKPVFEKRIDAPTQSDIQLSPVLSTGIYWVVIHSGEVTAQKRLVVQQRE